MIDMPEVLLRMKIASEYSLKELQTVFNTVANRINKKQIVPVPALAAQELFPEIFVRPRDEYIQKIMKEIVESESLKVKMEDQENPITEKELDQSNCILVYTGSIHVAPLSRAWNTGGTMINLE